MRNFAYRRYTARPAPGPRGRAPKLSRDRTHRVGAGTQLHLIPLAAEAGILLVMGRTYEEVDAGLARWIARQSMFFVGTAPLAGDGHINVSPKGPIGTLRVLGPRSVAYLDMIGSGAETIAHLRENGRIVIMLCAFEGPPRIIRLHGQGTVLEPGDARFTGLVESFEQPGPPEARRAVVMIEVTRIADSCGYGVPLLSYQGSRPHMNAWAAKKLRVGGAEALLDYQRANNSSSIDGLPAVER